MEKILSGHTLLQMQGDIIHRGAAGKTNFFDHAIYLTNLSSTLDDRYVLFWVLKPPQFENPFSLDIQFNPPQLAYLIYGQGTLSVSVSLSLSLFLIYPLLLDSPHFALMFYFWKHYVKLEAMFAKQCGGADEKGVMRKSVIEVLEKMVKELKKGK